MSLKKYSFVLSTVLASTAVACGGEAPDSGNPASEITDVGLPDSGTHTEITSEGLPDEVGRATQEVDQVPIWDWMGYIYGANEISVGGDNSVWVATVESPVNGHASQVFKLVGSSWVSAGFVPTAVVVHLGAMTDGSIFAVGYDNHIYYHQSNPTAGVWAPFPGCAWDIAMSKVVSNIIWSTSCESWDGGTRLQAYTSTSSNWFYVPGASEEVSVDNNGIPWITNSRAQIYAKRTGTPDGGTWQTVPGAAYDIAVSDPSAPWIKGTDSRIYHWEGNRWVVKTAGRADDIDVEKSGHAWIVDAYNIHRL